MLQSIVTFSALNKNKKQHLKQKYRLAKINDMETRKKIWSKVTLVAKKFKKNELQIKRTGLQVKIMKDEREKNLEIGAEKNA